MFKGGFFSVILLMVFCQNSMAKTWHIESQQDVSAVFENAQDFDSIVIKQGRYNGPWHIKKTLTLDAEPGAILDGQGLGHTLQISAEFTEINGLTIVNWGDDIGQLHSGVFVDKQANNVSLNALMLKGKSFGIWVDASSHITIKNCKIEGDLSVRSQDRGNGIHLFNVSHALVEANEVWHSRDGIYIDTSNNNQLISNYLHDLRYGVHYMYSNHNQLHKNITERTRTGYALMQSHHLDVQNNTSINDFNYGLLMNYITYSTISHNKVSRVRQGRNPNTNMAVGNTIAGADGKAVFVYNSMFNTLSYNEFSTSDLAIHLTGGSTDNKIYGNAFVGNRNQVKYVSNRQQEWSFEGKGNYWSDYLGWDINNDGLGDSQYAPNKAIDQLLWKYPSARLLFNSPGILLLRWVEGQFPVFKKPGITDSFPMMAQPINFKNNICHSVKKVHSHGS